MKKVVLLICMFSGFVQAEDFSKRLSKSFDTTPVGRRSDKLSGGANPVTIQAQQADYERRRNEQFGMEYRARDANTQYQHQMQQMNQQMQQSIPKPQYYKY